MRSKSFKFYIRIEAVNLDNFVYDTNDLATIRGSSIILLEWPRLFARDETRRSSDGTFDWDEVFEGFSVALPGPEFITRGASSAILRVEYVGRESTARLAVDGTFDPTSH